MRARAALALLAGVAALTGLTAGPARATLPPLYHVYVIVLENESASATFGPGSPAPYLSHTLRAQGAYLPGYFAVGHQSLDNYIAMISGQAPNLLTQTDCPLFLDLPRGPTGAYGQAAGLGCLYQAGVPTIAGQLQAAGLTWRDYNDGMGADPARESAVCGHPALNGLDGTQSASARDQYAARHNPFVYFHSVIDDTALCDTHVVGLDALTQDLANKDAPNYSFITPNLCNDGHDASCADGGPGGLARADSFLRTWAPRITGSAAFKQSGGLLAIVFDEASASDARACCGAIPGPGSPLPGLTGAGGGNTGAVLISPYIAPGTVSQLPYNHYALLRSVEDIFRLGHLGYAQLPGERSLGSDVFACAPRAVPVASGGRLPSDSEIEAAHVVRRGARAQLMLYSVGNASLRIVVRGGRGAPKVARHRLAPCRSYTFALPRGRGRRVTVSAYGGGGSQTSTLRY